MNKLGPSSIAAALRWTRQAALNARLLLNDYGLEGDDPQTTRKRRSLLTLIEALQQSPPDLDNGAATLELMEPPLALKAQVLRIRDRQVALAFNQPDGDAAVTLLNLIYNGEETFHWHKRLSTSDALLHWLGSLWRPDPILSRFS